MVGVRFMFDGETEKEKEVVVYWKARQKPKAEAEKWRNCTASVEPEIVKQEMSEAVRLLIESGDV